MILSARVRIMCQNCEYCIPSKYFIPKRSASSTYCPPCLKVTGTLDLHTQLGQRGKYPRGTVKNIACIRQHANNDKKSEEGRRDAGGLAEESEEGGRDADGREEESEEEGEDTDRRAKKSAHPSQEEDNPIGRSQRKEKKQLATS
ncbi:hypothetical protein NDU88_002939 [Pleurodeles waltl]|uniref:Uncharacterized protein n=1 Tax=Pleurodeles waltl TaxID=8319 RepID=A0AAV7QAB8_PLEWA|nr:hypothetical protein NDU88_002939 [Pleurodeles waltl]